MKGKSKEQFWDYLLLASRTLLVFMLLTYGWSKLTGGQFGVTKETMNTPLKDIDIFRLSWYLADHEPFRSFIGISQIVTAVLLIVNRTVVLGAFMAIPIWLNILVWDMTFMGLYTPFTIRLSFYLLLTFLILWHSRQKVTFALSTCVSSSSVRFKYPVWLYLLLPLSAACLELIGACPNILIQMLRQFIR